MSRWTPHALTDYNLSEDYALGFLGLVEYVVVSYSEANKRSMPTSTNGMRLVSAAMRQSNHRYVATVARETNEKFAGSSQLMRADRPNIQLEDSQRMVIETDPNFVLTMFLLVAFVLSWLPLLCLKVFEYFFPPQPDADLSLLLTQHSREEMRVKCEVQ
ncbi:hypothetical protein KIN20_020133 [Parelaphostrongylus tenuis]|uniref:Uncharacterized protein n=1 Tax=Parelaphostrongylus tenuis TaxID=148309 RepID=A0AAD5N5M2_PARTN|nr:hypothetical protein KIN20_020133 [Parelaphostrongylus tenuis]